MVGLVIGQLYTMKLSSVFTLFAVLYSFTDTIRCTKPGGYFEQMEINIMLTSDDGTVDENHFMHKWSSILMEASEKTGKSLASYDHMTKLITATGFEDVKEKIFKVPIGVWSSDPKMKTLGRWALLFCIEGADSWALFLLSQIMKVSNSI
jgi:hypothetical protein